MRITKILVAAVAVAFLTAASQAAPPPVPPASSKWDDLEKRFNALESRLKAVETKTGAAQNCGEKTCPSNGGPGPCPCGDACPCRPAGMKAGANGCRCQLWERCVCGTTCTCGPKVIGAKPATEGVSLVKGYHRGVECWIPEGHTLEGWTKTPPAASAAPVWDCSSGVCRLVGGSATYGGYYSAPYYGGFGGDCSTGSCGAPAGFGGGMMSGGGCAGGSCGSSGGGRGLFGRRR